MVRTGLVRTRPHAGNMCQCTAKRRIGNGPISGRNRKRVLMTTRMRSEIAEQPAALRATLDALLPRVEEIGRVTAPTRQLLFIARGTSDNAAVYGRYLVETHAGRLASLAAPSVATAYRRKLDLGGVLAVALSQSGRTEEIVETLVWAGECGAVTVAVTNGGPDSPLAQAADLVL